MISELKVSQKKRFDKLAVHPLQSYEWGEFREKMGQKVTRLMADGQTAQVTWHKIPHLPWTIGYWPKGVVPTEEMIRAISKEAVKHKAIMVKMEPNVLIADCTLQIVHLRKRFSLVRGRALFTKWSFWWDLSKPESGLLSEMKQKTRYNTRLAEKKGVKIVEDNSPEAFEEYWKLTEETTKRQGFFAHTKRYHQTMFETLCNGGIGHLFKAVHEGKTLVTWMMFLLNGVLYYPYGASTRDDRNVFASNLMMWEVAKWGKRNGAKLFDLWGSPGPDPKPTDKWIGFHKFKEGYGAKLVEFVGTYDLVINPVLYWLYRAGEEVRWIILRFWRKLV